jgi:hypothetical protein
VAVKPWIRTSGSPSPARYRAGEIVGAVIVQRSYAFRQGFAADRRGAGAEDYAA